MEERRPRLVSRSKRKVKMDPPNDTRDTARLISPVRDPEPDYTGSANHIPRTFTNEALGSSVKPDYDSDPELGDHNPIHRTPIFTEPKTTLPERGTRRPAGGVSILHGRGLATELNDLRPQRGTVRNEPSVTTSFNQDDPSMTHDLAKLSRLTLDTITDCIERRYKKGLIYTRCGEILISVNPFKRVELCSEKYFNDYTPTHISDDPHLFAVSAKAYQSAQALILNQVILVSGESGAGKTEATKLLVQHLMSIAGSDYDTLQDRIIQVNPLLEAFGNAKTELNNNSSRFAKFLTLNINANGKVESARIRDYMFEKSRVVHHGPKERTFHAFYALLYGASDATLESVFISRGDKFRITGRSTPISTAEIKFYKDVYASQQEVFKLIKLEEEEIHDINIILSAVLHLGNIEFEDGDNDCVVIRDEDVVHKVAALLQLDVTDLTRILIERSGKMGREGSVIIKSKNKKQAEDERDATAKALYERMFGWLVRKINEALKSEKYVGHTSIGILDICGFENVHVNSFEQLCINVVNEELQNFMNKKVIEEEKELYAQEGVDFADVETRDINNDKVLNLFMEKTGIMSMIDEDTKSGLADDESLVRKLIDTFKLSGVFIPSKGDIPEFSIQHFAGKVTYSARSFIDKNRDTLSEDMVNCLKSSESLLIADLFTVQETETGSISAASFYFRGSRKPSSKFSKRPVSDGNLSWTINRNRTIREGYGNRHPNLQSGDLAKRNTHIKFFMSSVKDLRRAMSDAIPFFVRCIKPNDKQEAGDFRRDRVKMQLQYNGVREVARIRTCGFPIRYPKKDFISFYEELVEVQPGVDPITDIILLVTADRSQYRIGKNQVFMKESVKNGLDDALSELKRRQEEERRRKEEEERRRRKEEEERRRRKEEEEERRRKEEEKKQKEKDGESGTTSSSTQQPNSLPLFQPTLRYPLDPIDEVSTPGSRYEDSVYNRVQESSGSQAFSSSTTSTEEGNEQSTQEEHSDESRPENEKLNAAWDITQELTEEEERRDVHEQPILMFIKSIVYISLFIIILASFVFQKASFLLLVKESYQSRNKINVVPYLLLVIAICIPYILGWLITVAKLCFGTFKRPSLITWIWVFIMENLHTVGLCLLVFRILPQLDVVRSAMLLSATAIIPAILKATMANSNFDMIGGPCVRCEPRGTVRQVFRILLDILAMLAQISVIPLIILLDYFPDSIQSDPWRVVELVAAFILVSFSHWENFADGRLFCELREGNWFKNVVLHIRYDLQNGRHYPLVLTYLWKIGLTVLLAYLLGKSDDFSYESAFANLRVGKGKLDLKDVSAIIALTVSAFVGFYLSFGACMFQMQIVSLTIPAYLATPVVVGIFYLDCNYKFLNLLTKFSPVCLPNMTSDLWYHFLFGALWALSLLILTRHMWRPQVDRSATMARVFLNNNYCGILTVESIILNRRRQPCRVYQDPMVDDRGEILVMNYKLRGVNRQNDDNDDADNPEDVPDEPAKIPEKKNEDHPATPTLYACATMWHETRVEMVQLLKSLHRLDRDQYIRRVANEEVGGYDPDFYNFEAHIFFDDAMEPDDNDESVPNRWVKELVSNMSVACSSVHGKPMKVHAPTKVPTPYGGQLIWQMPGENLLFVHMKDIKKIRNRKRWSQVMYMYYLLGYRHIMASKHELLQRIREYNANHGNHGLNIKEINYLLGEESATKASNTFLLALDGDTDFSPGSIKILLDRMKDEKVGAACGRIHPIGKGPMVWYQKFEYAIGHWLQKAAEHVFGCVLCSPGCFSLFRASALMDTNVMKRYTTEPTEPGHHLQYDQGEDRWLCTLLLQQGYRIEYAAAADAWTYAPEGFFEFFNQRRRWMPSTIANILDLLGTASLTTKRNANMSTLYIGYQWLLMLMTILGPGTIIMMIGGAVKLVFKFTLIEAYIFAVVPAAAFTVICFWFSSRVQLIIATILSVVYTFIMTVVLVGTIYTASTESIFHPSVIVIVMLIGIFVISGVCHPQEIWCLVHGVLYLLTIPSGYLLLVIYSICNLNDVSWGTREVPTKAQRLEMEKKKKEKEELEKNNPKKGFLAKFINRGGEHIRDLTKLVKTLAPSKGDSQQQQKLVSASDAMEAGKHSTDGDVVPLLVGIKHNLEVLVRITGQGDPDISHPPPKTEQSQQQTPVVSAQPVSSEPVTSKPLKREKKLKSVLKKPAGQEKKNEKRRDELVNPVWSEDKGLGDGDLIQGNSEEMAFWQEFIAKYLKPIRPSPEERKKIADGLRDLRNSASFGLVIINLLWMALNFMFQLTGAAKFTIHYSYGNTKGVIEMIDVSEDPEQNVVQRFQQFNGSGTCSQTNCLQFKIPESVLGLGFVILLLLLLLIQMFGMFIHRMGTLQHLLAITEIRICKAKESSTSNEQNREDMIRRIKEVLKLPMTGDPGAETQKPKPAPNDGPSNWGVTFAPKSHRAGFGTGSGSANFHEYLGKTLAHPMLAARAPGAFLDSRNRKTLKSVKQRLASGHVQQKMMDNINLGKSLRPMLPPRGTSVHQPKMAQASNWGFTKHELYNADIEVEADYSDDEFEDMGPMAKTLFQKSKIIHNETHGHEMNHRRYTDINWNEGDVAQGNRRPSSTYVKRYYE